MQHALSTAAISAIRAALLAFFDESARPLPWRQTRDPYAVWVSEVMSQQTRVETVVPYYYRWLDRFPDIATLADAPVDDVLKVWEGLGYYSRARNLHAAARIVRERHDSALPSSHDALRALPGVGEYTAGAVSSIAFGERRPAVDGNVRRVLARVLDLPAPSAALLRDVAATLVPDDRPGDFNQALMELGATICTPRSPRCGRCPIAARCTARAAGTAEERPARRTKKRIPVIDIATAVLRDPAGRLMIVRRPEDGLLGGLWCFPGTEMHPGDDPQAVASAVADVYVTGRGEPTPLGTVEHVFSHRRERYHCFVIEAVAAGAVDGGEWIDDADPRHALPRAQQRIRTLALADGDARRTPPSAA
ncbi:MAG TPA: A/G-specific adenine glycosylase [Longimicrobiales bacterium]|nr:A/G-specific adenine glycosylase [Longimicrobiales bacterium]